MPLRDALLHIAIGSKLRPLQNHALQWLNKPITHFLHSRWAVLRASFRAFADVLSGSHCAVFSRHADPVRRTTGFLNPVN